MWTIQEWSILIPRKTGRYIKKPAYLNREHISKQGTHCETPIKKKKKVLLRRNLEVLGHAKMVLGKLGLSQKLLKISRATRRAFTTSLVAKG